MRVEICGGIGAGKTTLANLLGRRGYLLVKENFRANPFWKAFYQDPNSHQFETEITFLLQHYHAIKLNKSNQNTVCDFSFFQDLAYAKMGLNGRKLRIFEDILIEGISELSKPSLLVCLDCESSILIDRIRNRNRKEEKDIGEDFLTVLSNFIYKEALSFGLNNNVLHINSGEINFLNNKEDQKLVLNQIAEALTKS